MIFSQKRYMFSYNLHFLQKESRIKRTFIIRFIRFPINRVVAAYLKHVNFRLQFAHRLR